MCQKFRSWVAWLKVSQEMAVKTLAKAATIPTRTVGSAFLPDGSLTGTGSWQVASVPLPGLTDNLVTGQLASSEWAFQERARQTCSVFYDLASEVTLHHFHDALMVTQVSLVQHGREPHKSVNPREGVIGAPCWLGHQCTFLKIYSKNKKMVLEN